MKYQIQIAGKTYDLELENHRPEIKITYRGKPVVYDFEQIHANLYSLILYGKQYRVWLNSAGNGSYTLVLDQTPLAAEVEDERQRLRKSFRSAETKTTGMTKILAPMPGLVSGIEVETDQHVEAGQGLLIVEAMKMENEIKSPVNGTVKKIHVNQGDAIEKDALLLEINE